MRVVRLELQIDGPNFKNTTSTPEIEPDHSLGQQPRLNSLITLIPVDQIHSPKGHQQLTENPKHNRLESPSCFWDPYPSEIAIDMKHVPLRTRDNGMSERHKLPNLCDKHHKENENLG
ncbi:hypothetical protein FRC02_000870 [Tulasnella sp. 418]|nr:hypothetical protein FRC02_000870 [Tulasnella sp. 418]